MARFVHEVPMRWSDMDAYRHVNNSAYLAYLEQARVAMFFDRNRGFNAGTVIARHEIDYLLPVVYHPQPLRVEVWIEKFGGARFVVRYEVYDVLDGSDVGDSPDLPAASHATSGPDATNPGRPAGAVLAARAATVCVTFDFERDRPRRLTAEECGILAAFADEPQPLASLPT